jgi:hypothetical protein
MGLANNFKQIFMALVLTTVTYKVSRLHILCWVCKAKTYTLIIFPPKYGLHIAGFGDVNTREYLKPNSFTLLIKLSERFTQWITKFFKIFPVASCIHNIFPELFLPNQHTSVNKAMEGLSIIQTVPSTAVLSSTDISAGAEEF